MTHFSMGNCVDFLSISRQIYLAVGCTLALLTVLAGLSYFATSKLSGVFSGYKETAQQTQAANELLEKVSDAQLAAYDYRFDPSDEHAQAVWQRLDDIAERQQEAEDTLAEQDTVLALFRQVAVSTQGYKETFSRLAEFNSRSDRIVDNLLSTGSSIRAKLTKVNNFALANHDIWLGADIGFAQQSFMRSRFHNERFLLTGDLVKFELSMAFLAEAIGRLRATLTKINDPYILELTEQSIGEMWVFLGLAHVNQQILLERNHLRKDRLDVLGRQIREQLGELLQSAVDHQEALGIDGTASAESTLNYVVIISILALCLGSALGMLVARHVSGSVRDMADTMSELADGNLDVPVRSANRRHELGMMARALEVFRNNARHLRRSLDKERELSGLQRQFVAMVSHEFRTPLAIIDGNAQRLLRGQDKLSVERVSKVARSIRTSVLRLTDLMESVLSAARMEEGRIKFEPEPFEIRDVITEICSNYGDMYGSHFIHTDLSDLPATYRGDAKLLWQVFSNLVSNAVKYSPEGTAVHVQGKEARDGALLISIEDEGIGIPEDEVEMLFERFFRASTSTGISGSGIGLHLVKCFVEMHGGGMDVKSTVGKGTVFQVRLPQNNSEPRAADDAEADRLASPTLTNQAA